MRYSEIKEAKMSKGVLLSTTPNFQITCGFEVEVAMKDFLKDFDYEEYFDNMGESLEPPASVVDEVYDKYSIDDVLDVSDYWSQMENNIPDGYRLATDEEREKSLEQFEYKDNWLVIVDEEDGEVYDIDMNDLSDVEEWFNDIYSEMNDAYIEALDEKVEEAKQDWINEKKEELDRHFIMAEMLISAFSGATDYDIENGSEAELTKGSDYIVEPDASINPEGMELVSPVFNDLDEMLDDLEAIFEEITNSDNIFTNDSTGLHINIGGFDTSKLDYLKLILFLGEGKLGTDFDREYNSMTEQLIPRIVRFFKQKKISAENIKNPESFKLIRKDIEYHIMGRLRKYYSVNFEKILDGYLEFRSLGGAGYEHNFEKIKLSVLRMIRALNIATDSNAYKQEYMKKVSSLLYTSPSGPKKVGQTLYPELEDAKVIINRLYKFLPTDNIKNHEDFIVSLIKAHDEFNDRNNMMLVMDNSDYTDVRNTYARLKARNLKSPYYSIEWAKKFLEDKKEFMPEKTYKFISQLIR